MKAGISVDNIGADATCKRMARREPGAVFFGIERKESSVTAYMDRSDRLSLLTQAAAEATGRRFCSHHQGQVAAGEGDFVMRNKVRRWVCFRCQKNIQGQNAALLKQRT